MDPSPILPGSPSLPARWYNAGMIERYIGNAAVFPVLGKWEYFNHSGVSPWATSTTRAVAEFAEQFGLDCFLSRSWGDEGEQLRAMLATFIGAEPDEVALVRNTGDAISIVSSGLDWKAGDRIVVASVEYPSNVYPWMDVCERHGAELVKVEERTDANGVVRVDEAELMRACEHHRTKLLAVSHVQWASGQRMDLDRLGAFCREKGILFAVDAIQSLGVVPVDVKRSNIDFLFSGGHKWLMSPPGAGLLYCKRELIERVNPPMVGWLSVINPMKWELNYTRRTEAGKFETGTHAYGCLVGLKASVTLLSEIGIDAIHAQVKSLGDRFASGAAAKGYTVVTPRDGKVGGAVCFTSPVFKPADLVKRMREEHRTELAARSGRMRFSPHFYNTLEQVDRLIGVLPGH